MTSKLSLTAPAGTPFIDAVREFDAPRELVFRAWSEPDLLVRWLGPRRMRMTIDRWESNRDGGAYRYVHHDDASGAAFGFRGVFHGPMTIDGGLQTFEFEGYPGHVSLDRLILEERDGRTIARMHSVFQSVEDRDAMVQNGMEGGMAEGFDRLDEVLADLAAKV
jgi:uncharacterized protein YndB with AHSA1/START domain